MEPGLNVELQALEPWLSRTHYEWADLAPGSEGVAAGLDRAPLTAELLAMLGPLQERYPEELRSRLLAAGWPEADIAELLG